MRGFWRRGEPYVWATGLTLAVIICMTALLIGVVVGNGIGVFWPAPLVQFRLDDGSMLLGEEVGSEAADGGGEETKIQLKVGNRDLYGLDFRWVDAAAIRERSIPAETLLVERREHGNFHGYLRTIEAPLPDTLDGLPRLAAAIQLAKEIRAEENRLTARVRDFSSDLERLRHTLAKRRHQKIPDSDERSATILAEEKGLLAQAEAATRDLERYRAEHSPGVAIFADATGAEVRIPLATIVRFCQPNAMNLTAKAGYYLEKIAELLWDEPRESNTEGGLFPAIFGTVMLVFLMSALSFPLGVMAGIYLREYAKDGLLVKIVRIAVNNLAGIPSIVYGIFGLGFFVYGIGGAIDQIFFPERLPAPTFGTGGILWASLTLGLLTVPVVIVATEEALGSITPGIREGSLALGATKFQTLTRLLLPMASPGIMTGFILAMARAAGEVAPLMITGVVKLAPELPLDGTFPFLHLDRKFMHLGFHIYDIGFQSPNVEAAKPMVYVTTLLLILIVLALCSTAIRLRNHMRKRYAISDV